MKFGYCCNVHGGRTLDEVKSNLLRYASNVKAEVAPDAPMPIGLWLSQSAIDGLGSDTEVTSKATQKFASWLAEHGFEPFTLNGFPLGDFHQEVVKHEVYLPTWADRRRLEYTVKLAEIQATLLAASGCQSKFQTISTLPLGWPPIAKEVTFTNGREFLSACAGNLEKLATELARLQDKTDVKTMVCIEPEPGCVLDTCEDVCTFFHEYLFGGNDASRHVVSEHLGVCHDICHSAVMFEEQAFAVASYKDSGIKIGKVQVSSAIKCQFDVAAEINSQRIEQLTSFCENKYLHQTKVSSAEGQYSFFEDLPAAISQFNQKNVAGEQWRVHFHVPIFAERLGLIETTQDEIRAFMKAAADHDAVPEHFEIETYAWNVLPRELNQHHGDLAGGIARELQWFKNRFC